LDHHDGVHPPARPMAKHHPEHRQRGLSRNRMPQPSSVITTFDVSTTTMAFIHQQDRWRSTIPNIVSVVYRETECR
ncbi:hypothetical protein V5H41_28955, partial [Salmonella enterica]